MRQVAGLPDVLRPEPRTRPVRGAPVERRTKDHDVGTGVAARFRPVAALDSEEGDVRAELRPVTGHGRSSRYPSMIACSHRRQKLVPCPGCTTRTGSSRRPLSALRRRNTAGFPRCGPSGHAVGRPAPRWLWGTGDMCDARTCAAYPCEI